MTTRSLIRPGALALVAASSCLAGIQGVATAAPASSEVHAARSCSPPKYPGSGYFTSLRVSHTSCSTGSKVAKAHYRCRRKNGVRGHCHHAVLHFHCKEHRPSSARIPTQYSSRVTCTRGSRKVIFVYQQNT